MSAVREGHLRDLPHPTLNEVLKSNTYSAIKLLKTGKVHVNTCIHVKRKQIFAVGNILLVFCCSRMPYSRSIALWPSLIFTY